MSMVLLKHHVQTWISDTNLQKLGRPKNNYNYSTPLWAADTESLAKKVCHSSSRNSKKKETENGKETHCSTWDSKSQEMIRTFNAVQGLVRKELIFFIAVCMMLCFRFVNKTTDVLAMAEHCLYSFEALSVCHSATQSWMH